jgi:hypothetical protein
MSGKLLKLGCKVTSSIIAYFGSVKGQAFQEPQLRKRGDQRESTEYGVQSTMMMIMDLDIIHDRQKQVPKS